MSNLPATPTSSIPRETQLLERFPPADVAALGAAETQRTWNPLVAACRVYQSLFRRDHRQYAEFRRLYEQDRAEYDRRVFEYEYQAGLETLQSASLPCPNPEAVLALDFGCRFGGGVAAYASRFGQVIGVDINREDIEAGRALLGERKLSNVNLAWYDGLRLPLVADSVDLILSKDVIEHCENPALAMDELVRVLKPGGLLHIDFGPPWYHAHGKHCWDELPGWWTHLLFPRSIVMRTLGRPPEATWRNLELNCISVRRFHRLLQSRPLEQIAVREESHRYSRIVARIPFLRELVISRVVGTWQKIQPP